jgi:hypothetical protein
MSSNLDNEYSFFELVLFSGCELAAPCFDLERIVAVTVANKIPKILAVKADDAVPAYLPTMLELMLDEPVGWYCVTEHNKWP